MQLVLLVLRDQLELVELLVSRVPLDLPEQRETLACREEQGRRDLKDRKDQ